MKQRLLPAFVGATLLLVCWGVYVFACDDKSKSADASTAEMKSSTCTAAQAAACKAKHATTAAAVTASNVADHCSGAAAMTASTHTCTAAQMAACKAKGAKASSVTAANGGDRCLGMMSAASSGSCPHSRNASMASNGACNHSTAQNYDAYATGGAACKHGASTMAGGWAHDADCDACADLMKCEEALKAVGSTSQVVKLKNGVMYVYTADDPGKVRAVQAAMQRRNQRLTAITASGDKAHLCAECKYMRGAVASGKLTRELVPIEGGVLTLMTSNDPTVVARLHDLAGNQVSVRTKS